MPRKSNRSTTATSSNRITKSTTPRSAKSRSKLRPCPVCLDPTRPSQLITLTTTCTCTYCKPCLRELISLSLVTTTITNPNFPAKCCGRPLDTHDPTISKALPAPLRKAYRKKCDEMRASQPLYCANSGCEAFISDLADEVPLDTASNAGDEGTSSQQRFATCAKCRMKTCMDASCRTLKCEHLGVYAVCPTRLLDVELEKTAERSGWKRCPNCWVLIERVGGCRNMRCTCRTEFCYDCGKMSKPNVNDDKRCKCADSQLVNGNRGIEPEELIDIGVLLGFGTE